MPGARILVVDDEPTVREVVSEYLRRDGYEVCELDRGDTVAQTVERFRPDLVVLDVMLPGASGMDLLRDGRVGGVPVILLTARVEEADRILGLEFGADDYVTKPFNPRELLARIKAVLRRAHALPPSRETAGDGEVVFDRWKLRLAQRELVGEDGVSVALSTGEFRLLSALLERPGMVLSREQLLDITRGRQAVLFDRSVDNQVSRLRRKIERDPANPQLIKTVWGGGYTFAGKVERP